MATLKDRLRIRKKTKHMYVEKLIILVTKRYPR